MTISLLTRGCIRPGPHAPRLTGTDPRCQEACGCSVLPGLGGVRLILGFTDRKSTVITPLSHILQSNFCQHKAAILISTCLASLFISIVSKLGRKSIIYWATANLPYRKSYVPHVVLCYFTHFDCNSLRWDARAINPVKVLRFWPHMSLSTDSCAEGSFLLGVSGGPWPS